MPQFITVEKKRAYEQASNRRFNATRVEEDLLEIGGERTVQSLIGERLRPEYCASLAHGFVEFPVEKKWCDITLSASGLLVDGKGEEIKKWYARSCDIVAPQDDGTICELLRQNRDVFDPYRYVAQRFLKRWWFPKWSQALFKRHRLADLVLQRGTLDMTCRVFFRLKGGTPVLALTVKFREKIARDEQQSAWRCLYWTLIYVLRRLESVPVSCHGILDLEKRFADKCRTSEKRVVIPDWDVGSVDVFPSHPCSEPVGNCRSRLFPKVSDESTEEDPQTPPCEECGDSMRTQMRWWYLWANSFPLEKDRFLAKRWIDFQFGPTGEWTIPPTRRGESHRKFDEHFWCTHFRMFSPSELLISGGEPVVVTFWDSSPGCNYRVQYTGLVYLRNLTALKEKYHWCNMEMN